jgi:hypothetical protein
MRMTGLEPAQAEAHYPLKVACGIMYYLDFHILTNYSKINSVRFA